ncbi:MAG: polysaccharide pyruvyl transferase family protein [Oscillospiraceae bacterium]|nr:polysaccharide pyruvyl transferase family protein [Oscillospiraceae bacterium]
MNKHGIITFHRTANFGSCLQAYALYKAVADLGYNCELIDYRCPAIEEREGVQKHYLFTPKDILRRILYQPITNRKYKSLLGFLEKNAQIGMEYTPATIQKANDAYEKFIVGSDIVWGVDITKNDYNYFLEFVRDNSKKYAFSSSVGNSDVAGADPKIPELLKSFRQIAVREQAANQWVRELSGKEAQWVCDPTMLLTAQQWNEVVKPKHYKDDYVLVYFLDNNGKCLRDAKAYAAKHGLRVKYINYGAAAVKGVQKVKPTSLQEFLGLIQSAKFVFTASYHGMLFSLYYQKEFVFYTRAHSDRVLSLANRLGIGENCADNMAIETYKPICYDRVDAEIVSFREESISILTEMLQS